MSELDRKMAQFNVGAFVRKHGGYKESRSRMSCEYLIPCPKCASDRLRWQHPGKCAWVCWGCKASGGSIDLVMLLERCDDRGAIKLLTEDYVGGDATTGLPALTPIVAKDPLAPLPERRWPDGVDLLSWHAPPHAPAVRYLEGRGIVESMAVVYRLGFGRSGRLKDRIVFPCFMDGRLVYWQARAIWDPPANLAPPARKEWIAATHYRKTLNPTTEGNEASAADVLFASPLAGPYEHVVVCEGPVDAIKVGLHAVALLGKVASSTKVSRLLAMRAKRYTVYLDPGQEERKAAASLAAQLGLTGADVRIAVPPEGRDPGSLSMVENAGILAAAQPYRAALGALRVG